MTKPRIIVTGAAGKTGSAVTTELLKAGFTVRALVRGEDDRSARLKAQGAEIAVAGMSDVERIADALRDKLASIAHAAGLRRVHATCHLTPSRTAATSNAKLPTASVGYSQIPFPKSAARV